MEADAGVTWEPSPGECGRKIELSCKFGLGLAQRRRWRVRGTWERVTDLRGTSGSPRGLYIWQERKVETI